MHKGVELSYELRVSITSVDANCGDVRPEINSHSLRGPILRGETGRFAGSEDYPTALFWEGNVLFEAGKYNTCLCTKGTKCTSSEDFDQRVGKILVAGPKEVVDGIGNPVIAAAGRLFTLQVVGNLADGRIVLAEECGLDPVLVEGFCPCLPRSLNLCGPFL